MDPVLLPIVVSVALTATVFVLIYKIPPKWVTIQTDRLDNALDKLDTIASPSFVGDSIHHAVTKNNAEVLTILGEEANGILHEAIPELSTSLANEAVGLVASMYSKGVAKDMGKRSGAARGYLALPGIQKQAVKTGTESLLGGALGGVLPPEIAGMISPEMIQAFMGNMLGNKNNGPSVTTQSQQSNTPILGSPV